MSRLTLGRVVLVMGLGLCCMTTFATGTVYLNNFGGSESAFNVLPNKTGLEPLFPELMNPSTNPAECTFSLRASGLSSDCSLIHTPSADIPFNALTDIQAGAFGLASPNGVFTTTDSVITFEIRMSYDHDTKSQNAIDQAAYYQTDVNDLRLGWGFVAVTSPNSPVNLCLGITSNKIVAFLDGTSQDPDHLDAPGYLFVGLKELADYKPGSVVDVKIEIDKASKTGTYFVNGVRALTTNLAGTLPDLSQMTLVKTMDPPLSVNRNYSLDGWSFSWNPVNSNLGFASLGTPNQGDNRYTEGGLVDNLFDATIFKLFTGIDFTETLPTSYLHPYGSWVTGGFAFGTQYKMTLNRLKVQTRNHL